MESRRRVEARFRRLTALVLGLAGFAWALAAGAGPQRGTHNPVPGALPAAQSVSEDAPELGPQRGGKPVEPEPQPIAVTIEAADDQSNPAYVLPIDFEVAFTEPIDPSTFTVGDVVQQGSAPGVTWQLTATGDDTNFNLRATDSSGFGSIVPALPEGSVLTPTEETNTASASSSVLFALPPPCPDATYLYAGLWTVPRIFGLCVNNTTGGLTLIGSVTVASDVRDLAIADGLYYVDNNLTRYDINTLDGNISFSGMLTFGSGSFDEIVFDPTGTYLYGTHSSGKVYGVNVTNGQVPVTATEPINPLGIGLRNNVLYVANQYSFIGDPDVDPVDEIAMFDVNPADGTLSNHRWTMWSAEADYFVFHPTLDYIYFTNRPGSSVTASLLDGSGLPQPATPIFSGFGATRLAINEDGTALYVLNNISNNVAVFRIDVTGQLVQNTIDLETTYSTTAGIGAYRPEDLVLHPNGDFLYVIGAGDATGESTIVIYDVNGNDTLSFNDLISTPDPGGYRLAIVDLGP